MTEKKEKLKKWGIPAGAALALLLCIWGYRAFFGSTFHIQDTVYLYIDEDDNIDSVYVKLEAVSKHHAMSGFKTLARHSSYGDHVRTGRYEIEPGNSAFTVFRKLKNGFSTG